MYTCYYILLTWYTCNVYIHVYTCIYMGIYTCIYIYNVYIHVYTYYLHDIHVIYVCTCNVHVYILPHITYMYDVATISRLLKCIGLFCKRVL